MRCIAKPPSVVSSPWMMSRDTNVDGVAVRFLVLVPAIVRVAGATNPPACSMLLPVRLPPLQTLAASSAWWSRDLTRLVPDVLALLEVAFHLELLARCLPQLVLFQHPRRPCPAFVVTSDCRPTMSKIRTSINAWTLLVMTTCFKVETKKPEIRKKG